MYKLNKKIVLCVLLSGLLITLLFGGTSALAKTKIKAKSVVLDPSNVTLAVGDIVTLNAVMTPTNSTDSLKWTSSNKKVASVSKNGVVTAKAEGSTKITVKISGKKKRQFVN